MPVDLEEFLPVLSIGEDAIKLLAPVKFSGQVENTGAALVFRGHVTTTVELPCSRCMEAVPYQVQAPFLETFSNQPNLISDEKDEEIYPFEGDEIDITSQVSRTILLELPMKILCREECKGLCPECGVNLNFAACRCVSESIDPRFMTLKKFFEESSTEGGVVNGSTEEKNL